MKNQRKKARLIFILFGVVINVTFRIMLDSFIISSTLTVILMVVFYILWANRRMRKRLNALLEDCDPEKFIEITNQQIEITGKQPSAHAILTLSIVSGLIELGKFNEALETLKSIDKSYISAKNGSEFSYTLLHATCLYELGEIDQAEKIYETEFPLVAPVNARMIKAMQIFIAERLYFVARYEEAREMLEVELETSNQKAIRLNILYKLALIDEELCDYDMAIKKFEEISFSAPKLWIAEQSKLRLAKYEKSGA